MSEIEKNAVITTEDIQPIVPKDFIKKVETTPKTGMYLIEPHAHWISTGFKTGFVKSKKYDVKPKDPVYLLGHGLCYGTMLIGEPQEISIEEFGKLEGKHRITEKTREKWCKDYKAWCNGPLYFYPVKMVERFKPATVVTLPKGTQNWIDAKNIKFEKLKELPMGRIIRLHAHSHLVQDMDLHNMIDKEFMNRKMSHPYLDFLDRIQEFLIQDWKTYNAKELIKTPHGRKVVLDDHRIVHAWWHLLQSGKKMVSPQFKDYSLTEQKEIVRGLHNQIADAFKSMGWNYTPLKESDSLSKVESEATFEELLETLSMSTIEEEVLVDVSKIEFKDLEGIDDIYCKKLSDKDLVALDKKLHAIYREQSKVTEPLSNAHIFCWSEMVHRNIRHTIDDPLTEATALDVVEYPTPKGFASQDKPDESIPANFQDLPVLRVLSAFPEQIILMDPPAHIHICGSTVNKDLSIAGHDIDVLIKQSFPDKRLINALTTAIRTRDPEVAKRIHLVFDPNGPQVGYCYSNDTEVLTEAGWKKFEDVKLIDKIATLNNGYTKYEFPIEKQKFYFQGKLISIQSKFLDLLVTPNHRLFVLDRENSEPRFIEAYKRPTHHKIPRTGIWIGKEEESFELSEYFNPSKRDSFRKTLKIPMVSWLKFMGYYLSEGYIYHNKAAAICQNFGPKRDIMRKELAQLPFKICEGKEGFKIYSVQLVSYLRQFGKAHSKFVPINIKELSSSLIKIFLDAIHLGDGTFKNNWRYFTCSKQLADDVQELWFKTGKGSRLKFREDRKQFEVYSHEKFKEAYLKSSNYTEISYSGFTHCLTVPSGIIYVRRNGKSCWCGNSVPMYRLAYVRVPSNEWGKHSPWEYLSNIAVGKPIRSLKSGTGFDKFEFFDPTPLWNNWAASRIEKGIVMQKKFDGMRIQIHRNGDKVWFFTEDRQRDRADIFKKSVEELVKKFKADNFIIDTEMVWYNCQGKDTKDKEAFCGPRPREEMIPWITSSKMALDDEDIVFHVHDCMMYDGQDITQKPYTERLDAVNKIIPTGTYHFKSVPGYNVNDKREFDRTLARVRRIRGSEGAMLKQADSIYKLTGRTTDWAKIKNVKEIDVMVWEVVPKKDSKTKQIIPGQYMYDCVISVPCNMKDKIKEDGFKEWKGKCYYLIGRTYSSAIKCEKGDILAVRPIRVAQFEDKGRIYWTWMFPTVKAKNPNKTEPDGLDVVKKLIAAGTAPLSNLSEELVKLPTCPFYEDLKICPLKPRFARTMDDLSKMQLKFPVACSLAYYWKCRYVKPYYYDYNVGPDSEDEKKMDEECPCKKIGEQYAN